MKVCRALCLCALLLVPLSLQAQNGAAKRLSGRWGGTLGPRPTDGFPVTFDLSIDPRGALKGVISGPKITTGDAMGTYDAKTGAVAFRVAIRGEGAMTVNLAGMITADTLLAQSGEEIGRVYILRVVRGMKMPALPASAGPKQDADPAAAAARRTFTEVSGWVARAAALVPAEKYAYRPVTTVRTFGELVGHLADSYTYYCTRASGKEIEWSDAIEKGTKDKATLATRLKQAQDLCTAAYAKGQIGALVENVGHTNLHYGNMITYIRMLGMTPPSS